MQKVARMKRELEMLHCSPPPGVSCSQDEDDKDLLKAQIIGGEDTPYRGGLFHLDITIPSRYPFEPPKVIFKTPIYHPNIDTGGRICLDSLKMPPQGAWRPSLNVSSILITIQLLMAEPNPDDPLMTEISAEYKCNRHLFNEKAKQWTRKHATLQNSSNFKESERILNEVVHNVSTQNEAMECSSSQSNPRKRISSDNDSYSIKRKR